MNVGSLTEETQTANLSRERLWELMSADWLSRGSESNSWQQSYHGFLREEGVDAEMQKRALLLQLWTMQVRTGLFPTHRHTHKQTNLKQTRGPTMMPNLPPVHTQTACLNSSPRRAACRQFISERQWIPLCRFTHSYMPQLVRQSGVLTVLIMWIGFDDILLEIM